MEPIIKSECSKIEIKEEISQLKCEPIPIRFDTIQTTTIKHENTDNKESANASTVHKYEPAQITLDTMSTQQIKREVTDFNSFIRNLEQISGVSQVGWLKAEDQTILTLHNKVVTHNSRISVTHDNHRTWQLHIRQVKESDRGCYMCQINTNVMKKQVGCVDVHVPPDILYDDTSTDISVQETENATLVCKATGHPPPRITWRREDGEPILLRRGPRDVIKVDTYNGSLLHFWRLDRRQMGAFLCIASNDVPPAVSKRIILNVNFAPVVKVPNQLLGAPLGTDVQLECYVEAFPNTINYWVKNRGEMLLDGPKYSIRENRSSYKVFMWLVIRSFGRTDIGTYNCVSTNSLGRGEGTLRLYEIKIYTGLTRGSTDNHVAIIGGLAEAAREQSSHTNGDSLSENGVGITGHSSPVLVLLISILFVTVACSR